MGRGNSSGGGQSSLGYLFGSGEAPNPKPTTNNAQAASNEGQTVNNGPSRKPVPAPQPVDVANQIPAGIPSQKPVAASQSADITKQIPAGIHSNVANNYFRADGQNSGNFITDRPSTKVHAAPGGGSSLGYLFGGGGGN